VPDYEVVNGKIGAIEAEMKRLGWWREAPLPEEMYNFRMAFALDTMPFQFWLQFVFIPKVHEIIAARGNFPRESHVAAQAVREFDGMDEASDLITLLSDFDRYIERA
jgi:uncharacterized protein YqcC (DUF446 family)